MKNMALAIVQALSRAAFGISVIVVIIMTAFLWLSFFREGGQLALDAAQATLTISGEKISSEVTEELILAVNKSSYIAGFVLFGFTAMMFLFLLPVYLVMKIVLSLKPEQWFNAANTNRLRYLAYYCFCVGIFSIGAQLVLRLLVVQQVTLKTELHYFFIGLGVLLLSYMHQQGVKLREEAEFIV